MTLEKFLAKVKNLSLDEIREDSSENLEFVTTTAGFDAVKVVLEEYFGPALKPPGESPNPKSRQYTAPYGGVRHDQTFYCLERETDFDCAMIWPWQDGQTLTVKIFRAQKPKETGLLQKIKGAVSGQKKE